VAGPAHIDLQKRVPAWLRGRVTGRGLRFGYEIRLAEQYVADVVALCSFQGRYHDQYSPGEKYTEQLLVFEAKATRADYLSTFRHSYDKRPNAHVNRLTPIGSLHWIVAFPKVCDSDEVPDPWGLLVRTGGGLRELKAPTFYGITEKQRLNAAYELLWYGNSFAEGQGERLTFEEWREIADEASEHVLRCRAEEKKP